MVDRALAAQATRFVIVGAANTALTYAVIWMLNRRFAVPVGPASAAGYAVGAVQGYLLSRYWTFRGPQAARVPAQATGFVAVNLLCAGAFAVLNMLLVRVLPLLASSLAATVLVMPLSFALYRWGVFRARSGG